jgi:hypothetical protein
MNNSQSNELKELTDRIEVIERKLDLILLKLDGSVIKNCDKMGTHIDFVNSVYTTVKVPLNYISNKIQRIINPSSLQTELPLINNYNYNGNEIENV